MDFDNKTVIITGAASGIGWECCRAFGQNGAKIVMCDVNEDAMAQKVEQLKAENIAVTAVKTDVRSYDAVASACKEAYETFGSIDIVVCCAGGTAKRMLNSHEPTFWQTPIEVYDWGIDVNLKGPFYMAHAAMPYMIKTGGVFICIGSVTGIDGDGLGVDYAVSKSALMDGFVKSIAMAGAPHNIRACCVAPGPVLTRAAMGNMPTLMHRAARPQEIVDAITFLASDKASFITGTTLLADGGHVLVTNKTWGAK